MNLPKSGWVDCQKAVDCEDNNYNSGLTEQFIHRLYYEGIISEILREVSAPEDIDDTTSEWVLLSTQGVEP